MAVQFILGASGAGKTEYLYHEVIQLARQNREITYYYIVPEQFTLQTQKDLAVRHPSGGILNIDVTSLARLAHKVFEELGGEKRTILKDIGKSMVVKRILSECRDQLSVFATNAKQSGFVEEVKSLLSESLQYGVKEEKLREIAAKSEDFPLLSKKLNDVLIFLSSFQEFLGEHYLTTEGIYDVFASCMEESKAFQNCVIIMDGFTGFTPSQYALLTKLMQASKQFYLALTLEESAYYKAPGEHELFYMSWQSMQKVKKLAEEAGCEVAAPVFAKKNESVSSQQNAMLAHLEQTLFRYPSLPWRGETENSAICIYAAAGVAEECRFTVTKAAELIQEQGYRYRDIAVVLSDIQVYGESLVQEFEKAGIPCFLDYKKNMSENMCAEYLKAVLRLAEQGLTTEGIFSYIKSGLSGWNPKDIWDLENYCLALGIQGYHFQKEWKREYRTRTEISLEQMNTLRLRVLSELTPMVELFHKKDATVKEWTTGLFFFLQERKLQHRLKEREDEFLLTGQRLRAKEYAQVYRVLLDLFDQLVELLGEEVLSPKEYRELVETGLHEAKVGLVPTGAEQIVIGDMERTRLKGVRALFFLGVNDGKIPASGSGKGIFSERDRAQLSEYQMELTPTGTAKMCNEQFYLYRNLTKPTDKLYLTYTTIAEDGKAVRASYLVSKLQAVFPQLRIQTDYGNAAEELIQNDKGRKAFLDGFRSFAMGEAGEEFYELYRFWSAKETKEQMQKLHEAAIGKPKEEQLSEKTAKKLYGEKLFGSVTRLERYAACAFAHFLKYGLCLEERSEYKLAAPDIGNVYHDALQRFGEELLQTNRDWTELSVEERQTLIDRCAKNAVEEYANNIFQSSGRNEYMAKQMGETLKKTVDILTRQLLGSSFRPYAFEQEFYHTDRNLSLYGKIDRYDVYDTEELRYVKIVDYKSGTRDFDLPQMYYGLTMQLAVYMTAAMKYMEDKTDGKKKVPAAMFYYHVDNPIVEKTEQPELEQMKKLRVKGLVNSDYSVIRSLDEAFADAAGRLAASVKSLRIPVETNKEGYLTKRSKVASTERFEKLSDFVYDKLRQEGDAILGGDAAIAPYRLGKKTGCDYCEYAAVCGFDKSSGSAYRKLSALSEDEIWQKLN